MKKIAAELFVFVGFLVTVAFSNFAFAEIVRQGTCGIGCTYTVDENNNLAIIGTGSGATLDHFAFGPDLKEPSPQANILIPKNTSRLTTYNNVTIDGIKNFNESSLHYLYVTGDLKVSGTTSINAPFFSHSIIDGNVVLSDEIISTGASTFWSVRIDGNLVIPNKTSVGTTFFRNSYINGNVVINQSQCDTTLFEYYSKIGPNGKIYCQDNCDIEQCRKKIRNNAMDKTIADKLYGCADGNCNNEICGDGYALNSYNKCVTLDCERGYIKKSSCVKDCGMGYLGKEGKCISDVNGCGNGYKNMGGFCNRVRYTPAEAAAVANDDNTNVVTITFKK